MQTASTYNPQEEGAFLQLQPPSGTQDEKSSGIKCPFSNSSISSRVHDHNGGILISKYGDIKITIPEGAIHDGDTVTFHTAADLYGPFVLPSQPQTDLLSPYYWIGVSESYYFEKPIQVEFEHFAACDPSHYQLLTCEDNDKFYIMRPVKCDLSFKEQDGISWCTFHTYQCCSYCLFHGYTDPALHRIGAYYLKPDNFKYLTVFTVEIWFSFPISLCLKRNKEMYTKKLMTLDASHIFNASSDINSTSYFTLKYNKNDGWDLKESQSIIPTKEVNFYNYYKTSADLQENENTFSFPPRFIINVHKESECTRDLNSNIIVTLNEEEDVEFKSFLFKLSISVSPFTIKSEYNPLSHQSDTLSIVSHCCDEHKPIFRDLVQYSDKISSEWKRIALQLGIPQYDISIIDINERDNVKDKCYKMLETWLQQTTLPCWCHFIEALFKFRLFEVAQEAKKHLETPCHSAHANPTSCSTGEGNTHTHMQGETLNLTKLILYLKDVPQEKLIYFAHRLLPNKVVRDIRLRSVRTVDLLENICKEFLNEPNPSWFKVYDALKESQCDDLADNIETCCLPIQRSDI